MPTHAQDRIPRLHYDETHGFYRNDDSDMGNIGKYVLEEEIGRGGFGQVYRAFDPAMGRMVAIKILLSQTDKDQLARFKNEANATGNLRHKNIVTVYDYGEYENKPYL